ncbi:hypothetical protein K2X33_00615 [bacterium]|nr:hypothetical protein [bacterium]
MNDEKTTEIEIPPPMANIVRVDFAERRKAPRAGNSPLTAPIPPRPSSPYVTRHGERLAIPQDIEWEAPLWVRLAALGAILILSLFVL